MLFFPVGLIACALTVLPYALGKPSGPRWLPSVCAGLAAASVLFYMTAGFPIQNGLVDYTCNENERQRQEYIKYWQEEGEQFDASAFKIERKEIEKSIAENIHYSWQMISSLIAAAIACLSSLSFLRLPRQPAVRDGL